MLGRLSDSVGYGLEEVAAIVLPAVLREEVGTVLSGPLERRVLRVGSVEEEVDLWATGECDGVPVVVVGEVKSRIYAADVKRLAEKAARLAPSPDMPVVAVMFGFFVHPSAREAGSTLGVHLVGSRPG